MLGSFIASLSPYYYCFFFFFRNCQFTQSGRFSIAPCHNSQKQSTAIMIPRMAQVRGGSWLYSYMPLAERSSRCLGDKGRKGMSLVHSNPCRSLVLLRGVSIYYGLVHVSTSSYLLHEAYAQVNSINNTLMFFLNFLDFYIESIFINTIFIDVLFIVFCLSSSGISL